MFGNCITTAFPVHINITMKLYLSILLVHLHMVVLALSFSPCKEVTENKQFSNRRLYIFCFEGKSGVKFHKFIDVWKWTTYNLRHEEGVTVKVVQAPWNSRSTEKFLTKPKNYLNHVKEAMEIEKRSGRNVENAYAMIVDSDTLFSNPTANDIWQRFECVRQGKDLVVATETNCWLGRYCLPDDVNQWYRDTPAAYSVFVNSGAMMGTLQAVRDLLVNVTVSSSQYFIDGHNGQRKYDDQFAVTVYAMERTESTVLDIRQALFGTYQIFNPQSEGGSWPFVCRRDDSAVTAYNYNCKDLTSLATSDGVIYMDDTCAIRRMANNTKDRVIYRIVDSLAPDPIL